MKKYGYLRETSELAKKAGLDHDTGLIRTGLDEYLKVIFPNVNDWIHDKTTGIKELGNRRPDYRSETLKMVAEFDGVDHYKSLKQILRDFNNTEKYEKAGYKVVRIPWFIQLTNDAVKTLFGVEVQEKLFPSTGYPSFNSEESPDNMCVRGTIRAVDELIDFPPQLDTNIQFLKSNDTLTDASRLFIDLVKTRRQK